MVLFLSASILAAVLPLPVVSPKNALNSVAAWSPPAAVPEKSAGVPPAMWAAPGVLIGNGLASLAVLLWPVVLRAKAVQREAERE